MEEKQSFFEELCLPHLDAAYNLARLLVGRDADAQDVVQETYVRALKGFKGFRGDNARVWILSIVRNTAYSWLKKHAKQSYMVPSDRTTQRQNGSRAAIRVFSRRAGTTTRRGIEQIASRNAGNFGPARNRRMVLQAIGFNTERAVRHGDVPVKPGPPAPAAGISGGSTEGIKTCTMKKPDASSMPIWIASWN